MEDEFDRKPSTVAPGMTMPIQAGEQYTLRDDKGEALVLEGRDDPVVIEFLAAFDTYFTIHNTIPDDQSHIHEAAYAKVVELFEALPQRIKDQLPSGLVGKIVVP